METEVLRAEAIVGEVANEFDRFVVDMRDTPSTSGAMCRLIDLLRRYRGQSNDGGWRLTVEILRRHEIGRLLRNDPMVRRCQWRQPEADPYDIVEAFVMAWDDTPDALIEAGAPGQVINNVIINTALGGVIRERRNTVHAYLAEAALTRDAAVLSLGAGRAPETDLIAPDGPLAVARWMAVAPAASDDAILRRKQAGKIEWRTMPLIEFLDTARGVETFDLIYTVDGLDRLDDRQGTNFLEKAAQLLRPNGKLVVSAFAPDLGELAYADAALDWRPLPRGEGDLERLLKAMVFEGRLSWSLWRGGTGRAVFGVLERLSWAA